MRKQIDRHPERVVRDYTNDIRLKMGVQDERQFWRMVDWSRKVQPKFQRMSGMWRIHFYLSECLEAHMNNQPAKSAALIVQLQTVLVQMALDQGGWDNASLLWPGTNPFQTEEFGGSPDEMARILAYRKAISDLKLKTRNPLAKDDSGDEAEDSGAAPKRSGGGKRGGRGRGGDAAAPADKK